MKLTENRVALLGAQILAWHSGLAKPAIEATEQALLWLRQVAPYCLADGETRDPAADKIDALRATVAELQAELAAHAVPIAMLADSAASVHVETIKPQQQRTRCPHCEKIVAKNAPRIERDGDTWHAECWGQLSPATQETHAPKVCDDGDTCTDDLPPAPGEPDLPVETEADAPTFEPAPLGMVDRVLQGVDVGDGESKSVTLTCEVTSDGLKVVDFFETEDPPAPPADPWPQFAHLAPAMREWAIRRELSKRGA